MAEFAILSGHVQTTSQQTNVIVNQVSLFHISPEGMSDAVIFHFLVSSGRFINRSLHRNAAKIRKMPYRNERGTTRFECIQQKNGCPD